MAIAIHSLKEQPGYSRINAAPLEHESEEYRRAAEHHAGAGNFSLAAWYTQMYRLYCPDPPDSTVDVDCDVEW
jgi:hypothetical protein